MFDSGVLGFKQALKLNDTYRMNHEARNGVGISLQAADPNSSAVAAPDAGR